jgi:cell division septation protein DedD
MTTDNDDHSENTGNLLPRYGSKPIGDNERREPTLGSFDQSDDEEYEEPDRDADYASGYSADDVMEEDEIDDYTDEEEAEPYQPEIDTPPDPLSSITSEPDQHDSEAVNDWLDDEESLDVNMSEPSWPLRLFAVGAVALVLVAAGVYGVMQERSATEAELRELRATLATSAGQGDVRTGREALRELQQSYDALTAEAKALSLENSKLTENLASLETKLGTLQGEQPEKLPAADPQPAPAAAVAKTKAPVAPKPASPTPRATQPAPPASPGNWFVNFGSYSSRDMANIWAAKIQPAAGKVIVVPGTKDGKTYFRVRVVDLTGKNAANEVARKLETELQVSRLWVGQD